MKRIVSALIGLAVLAALAIVTTTSNHIVRPAYAASGCSDATVNGNYGLTFSGFTVPGRNNKAKEVPFVGEGLFTFDGAGNLSGTYNGSQNGQIFTNSPYNATYTVNSDCTGTLELDEVVAGGGGDVLHANVVISAAGREINFIQTDVGTVTAFTLKKTARDE